MLKSLLPSYNNIDRLNTSYLLRWLKKYRIPLKLLSYREQYKYFITPYGSFIRIVKIIVYSGFLMNSYFVCISRSKIFRKINPKADSSLSDTIASM